MSLTDEARQKLLSQGWAASSSQAPYRAITSSEGWDKSGKTHVALTAPEPIIFLDIDVGTEGVVEKFVKAGKDILQIQVRQPGRTGPVDETKAEFVPIFEDIRKRFTEALSVGEGTVVVDTMSEVYVIKRLAVFGKLHQILPQEYGIHVYPDLRDMVREAYSSKMNVIFTHKLEKNFNDPTKFDLVGFKEMPYLVQAHLRHWRTDEVPTSFRARIENCRHNPAIMGTILSSSLANGEANTMPMSLNFEMLLGLVHS